MLSRRKVLSSGVATASALILAATTGTGQATAVTARAARAPKRPFIPQPAHIPADYVPCC